MSLQRSVSAMATIVVLAGTALAASAGPAHADVPPTVVPDVGSVVEGSVGTTTVAVPVTLSSSSPETVTVQWHTLLATGAPSGQATPGSDYTPASGTMTFEPGDTTETAAVPVVGDTLIEVNEYIVVSFHDATNAVMGGFLGLGFGVITNDDFPTVVPDVGSVSEGNSGTATVLVPLALTNPSPQTVTVRFNTLFAAGVPGQATPGSDYTPASGTVTFAPHQTFRTVGITVAGDLLNEPDEFVVVSFHDATNAVMGGFLGLGFAVITNDLDRHAVLTVTPSGDLDGGLTVTVAGSGLTPGAAAGWCQGLEPPEGVTPSGAEWCGVGVNGSGSVAADGTFGGPLRLHRFLFVPAISSWVDCTDPTVQCNVGTADVNDLVGTGTLVPIGFGPPPPPPGTRGVVSLSPSMGVHPDDIVDVSGSGFRAGALVDLFQCFPGADTPTLPASCGLLRTSVVADGDGDFTTPLSIQGTLVDAATLAGLGGTTYDCVLAPAGPCRVVAAEAVDFTGTAVATPVSMVP